MLDDGAKVQIDENERTPALDEALAMASLVGAFVLYLSIGEWPAEFFVFARWVTFPLSLLIAYRSWTMDQRGWLVFASLGALLFNPRFLLIGDNGWDLIGAFYASAYGLFGIILLRPKTASIVTWAFGLCTAIVFALTYYVNHNMPHGPKHATGDVVCQNDGRGPCGEEMVEDMSELNIPDWAKFLRKNVVWTFFFLLGGTVFAFTRSQNPE